jgi:hypothetical protein
MALSSTPARAQDSPAAMVGAAQRFYQALTAPQREQAVLGLDSDERVKVNFSAEEPSDTGGLALSAMTPAQRTAAQDLLKAGLSESGYQTVTAIMQLEGLKPAGGKNAKPAGDPLEYRFTLFGTPSPDGVWGWRVAGHHLSMHYTLSKGKLAFPSPMFTGAKPVAITEKKTGTTRIFAAQEMAAQKLMAALSPEQQKEAMLPAAPATLLSATATTLEPPATAGLQSKSMAPELRVLLLDVVKAYAALLPEDMARQRLGQIYSAGIENLYFSWAAGATPTDPGYYRVQGLTFLMEVAHPGGDADHLHIVWRDFKGDFGRELLRDWSKEGAAPKAE